MNLRVERKIEVNKWIIKTRWSYVFGILFIGFLTKTIGKINTDFSYRTMISLALFVLLLNVVFAHLLKWVGKNNTIKRLNLVSALQILPELIIFTLIMHKAGGIDSISYVFYYLLIVSSAFLFGYWGAIITAVISGLLLNSLVILEFYNIIPHINRYSVETFEYQDLAVTLIKTATISIFYIIVGVFAGFGAKFMFKRERLLQTKSQDLMYEKNKVSSIITNFEDPIIFLDEKNRIDMFNPPAEKILKLSTEDIGKVVNKGNNLNMGVFKDIIKADYEFRRPGDRYYKIPYEEVTLYYKGRKMYYKVITASVSDKNKTEYGNMKIFYNITREKIIDRLKSEFISIAAHQLRTPLTVLKWINYDLIKEESGKLNKEQKDLLSKSCITTERMIELIDDLLNISRIEDGRFSFNFKKINFKEVIDEALFSMKKIAAKRKIAIKAYLPDKLPEMFIDKSKIVLVIQNLLDNAIKYTPIGGVVEIKVGIESIYLKIEVKDHGIGIPEKELSRLFSKFYRSSNAVRVETDGSGLGLYLAKNIIDSHEGKIYVDSKEGGGSSFVVSLPLKKIIKK